MKSDRCRPLSPYETDNVGISSKPTSKQVVPVLQLGSSLHRQSWFVTGKQYGANHHGVLDSRRLEQHILKTSSRLEWAKRDRGASRRDRRAKHRESVKGSRVCTHMQFFNKLVNGRAVRVNFGMNLLYEFRNPRNDCRAFTVLGTRHLLTAVILFEEEIPYHKR